MRSDERLREEVTRLARIPGYERVETENLTELIEQSKSSNFKSLVVEAFRSGLEYLPYIQKSATFFKVKENSSGDYRGSFVGMSVLESTKCYLCEENDMNSINLPCMHGGVCKACAKYNLGLSGQCPQCKGIIDKVQIYQIEELNPELAKGIIPPNFSHFSDLIPISLTQDYQDIDDSGIFTFEQQAFEVDPELGDTLQLTQALVAQDNTEP